jgi:glucokinase
MAISTERQVDGSQTPEGAVVGIDIGGSKIAIVFCDIASGDEIIRERLETPDGSHPRVIVELLVDTIRRMTKEAKLGPGDLKAAGVAVPGQVDEDEGRVLLAGNLRAWVDVPLRHWLESRLAMPVWVEQDANAAALGERWRGAARTMNNFVFLALGTGIGAGVVVNGRLHRGYHNAAGEVGNFVMDRAFLGKQRDGHGNLEKLIGGPALRQRLRKATGRKMSVEEAHDVADNNKKIQGELDMMHDYLAMAVINIAALLDPQAVIFGGGTSAAGVDLIEPIRARIDRELRTRPALIMSALGEDAQLHGAVFGALWALDPNLALREDLR